MAHAANDDRRTRAPLLAATALAGALLLGLASGALAQQVDDLGIAFEQQAFFVELTELARAGDEEGLTARVEALSDSQNYVELYGLGRFFAKQPTEHGLPRPDYARAIAFFEQALAAAQAASGRDARRYVLRCKYEIARMLMRSPFDEEGQARAHALLLEAGDQGLGQAALVLGQTYRSGELGTIDEAEAEQWYRRALSLGVGTAAIELSSMLATTDRPEAQAEADELSRIGLAMLQREALAGELDSAVRLGAVYTIHAVVPASPVEAQRWLTFAAGRGSPEAYLALAGLARTGAAGAPDPEGAGAYLLQAASLGSTQAALDVARTLVVPEQPDIVVDPAQARQWLDRAVAVGDPDAFYIAGSVAGQEGDFAAQRQLFEQASALGSLDAMFGLIRVHMTANDQQALQAVVADLEERVYRRPSAMVQLAQLKLSGDTGSLLSDVEGGVALLAAAVEQGNAAAMYELARLYELGSLVPADQAKAAQLMTASAAARHLPAVLHLADWNARGLTEDASDDRVRELLDQARALAREQGSRGMLTIGRAFIGGIGEVDLRREGIDWLNQAVAQGNPRAMVALADALVTGEAGEHDPEQAMDLYWRAVEAGDLTAHYQIGSAFATGMAEDIDFNAALEHYHVAADAGSADAAVEIGLAYASGTIVDPDPVKAYEWLSRAADAGEVRAMIYIANLVAMNALPDLETGSAMDWLTRAANSGNSDAQFQLALTLQRGLIGEPDPGGAMYWMEAAARNGHFQAQLELNSMRNQMDDENG